MILEEIQKEPKVYYMRKLGLKLWKWVKAEQWKDLIVDKGKQNKVMHCRKKSVCPGKAEKWIILNTERSLNAKVKSLG